jgi:endonuclease YncB( thermonuclease family)
LALLLPLAAQAQQSCLVVGITDGDTLKARCGAPGAYEQVTVRISEIDAPEKAQPFGERSKQSLSDLCFQAQAVISSTTKDRYGRTVARVECNGKDVALHQAQAGMAWWYVQYGKDQAIRTAEQRARASRVGLWADAAPVAPWEYRRPAGGSTAAAPVAYWAAAQSGECHVGPRGRTYTITASGRKNYGGC